MIFLTDPTSHLDGDAIGNLGDCIIKDAVAAHLQGLCPETLQYEWVGLDRKRLPEAAGDSSLLLCGANVLANRPYMNKHVWRPAFRDAWSIDQVLLVGVGWWKYQRQPGLTTSAFYRHFLSAENVAHSVRDSYTRDMLTACGVANVINTGCPTMWNLPDIMQFESTKADTVVFTLTDYSRKVSEDRWLVQHLLASYQHVVFFPQGTGDVTYLQSLIEHEDFGTVEILERSMGAYNQLLEDQNVDYVGTRLHGGIRALQKGRRSIIISVDNRAEVIAKDTGLPVVPRASIARDLPVAIETIDEIRLSMNRDGIEEFKGALQEYFQALAR